MNPTIQNIIQHFSKNRENIARHSVHFEKEKLNQILASLYSPGPSFQVVYNHYAEEFTYVSESIKSVLGYSKQIFKAKDFVEKIHQDDLQYWKQGQEIAEFFYFTFIQQDWIPFYKHSYQYRLVNNSGEAKLFLHQAIAVSFDEDYNMSHVLMNLSEINHISNNNNYTSSFIDIRNGYSYFNIKNVEELLHENATKNTITKREIEILRLLSEGFSSKEIGHHLHISYDTVRTHRNNILKKTKLKTITQVVSQSIREGLI